MPVFKHQAERNDLTPTPKGENGALQTQNRVDYSLNYSTKVLKLVDIIIITETDKM